MQILNENGRLRLVSDKGITDGSAFGYDITLEVGRTEEGFYEITKDEYERIMEERREKEDGLQQIS